MHERYLLAPGPTPVPERARLRMAESLIHHRGPEFKEIFGRVREGLKWLYQTDHDVITLTCSGTGAFEAGMVNFLGRGDKVVVIGGGKFGERWGDVARAWDMEVVELDLEWGRAVDPGRLAEVLEEHADTAMVTLTLSETSTGVLHPVREVAEVVREQSGALLAVDGITAVGVHSVPMDELGIDVLVAGSQKAFGVPPGLGFVGVSPRAWERYEQTDSAGYYFDLERERARQAGDQTAFTPGISQVLAMDVVLEMMREEGFGELVTRHAEHARATRAAVRAFGLETLAERPTNAVTAVECPEGLAGPDVVRVMREDHNAIIAGGQKHLKPRLFRLGHIGFFERADIINMISALSLTLQSLDWEHDPAAGLEAAQAVYAE